MAAGTGQGFLLPELPRKETVDSEQDGEAEPSVTATEPDTAESTSDTATGDSPSVSVLQSYITATYNITFDAKNKGRDDTFSFDVYYSAKAISTHEKATQFLDRLEREWERCDEMLHTLSGTFAEAYDRRHAPPQAQDVDNAAWACRKAGSVSQDLLTYLIGHQARLATKIGTDLEAPNGYLAILRPQIHVDEYETIPGESERSRQKSFSFSASKASNIASDKTALAIDPDLIQGSKGSKDKKMDVGKLKQLMERFEVPASTEDSKPSGGRGRGGSSRLPGGFPDEPEKTD